MWTQLLALLGAALLIWWLVKTIRNQPQAFSKENLVKSFSTMGVLGLILIVFVMFCILLLGR